MSINIMVFQHNCYDTSKSPRPGFYTIPFVELNKEAVKYALTKHLECEEEYTTLLVNGGRFGENIWCDGGTKTEIIIHVIPSVEIPVIEY